jgi:hypothetical protein
MVSVLTIATGLYSEFVPAFTASAIRHVKGLRQIYLFSDGDPKLNDPVAWLPWGPPSLAVSNTPSLPRLCCLPEYPPNRERTPVCGC